MERCLRALAARVVDGLRLGGGKNPSAVQLREPVSPAASYALRCDVRRDAIDASVSGSTRPPSATCSNVYVIGRSSASSDQPSKSSGQLGSSTPSAPDPEASQKREAGERKAANIRYGQGISEGGMGGTTTGQSGEADGPADEEGNAGRGAQGYDQRGGGEESSETIGG